jgi:hypothetical protein
MKEKNLFEKIHLGTEVEAIEAYRQIMANALRGMIPAIMARNFSHGYGKNATNKLVKGGGKGNCQKVPGGEK